MTRRLEVDLLAVGERVTRVPPKLMAGARDAARTYGKSDPIDALAVARAALREPDLPVAQREGPEREVRLLVDTREALVAERTRAISRLRWHLHELDATWDPAARSLDRASAYHALMPRLDSPQRTVERLARDLVEHGQRLTTQINALETEIGGRVVKSSSEEQLARRFAADASAHTELRAAGRRSSSPGGIP
jgi:transposase